MRLIQVNQDGGLSLTGGFIRDDTIPPYAILSHTWHCEEITYDDFTNHQELSRHKPGYAKLLFCAQQATRDGLQYFHVDACCIDRANHVELQTAIN